MTDRSYFAWFIFELQIKCVYLYYNSTNKTHEQMAKKSHLEYEADGIVRIDDKRYDTSKYKSLLHTWCCPHCNHSQLSYNDELTATEHFLVCKKLKKQRKQQQAATSDSAAIKKTLKQLGMLE